MYLHILLAKTFYQKLKQNLGTNKGSNNFLRIGSKNILKIKQKTIKFNVKVKVQQMI